MTKLYLESISLETYQDLNLAVFIKNLQGRYLWANQFFIRESSGFNALSEIQNKQDYDFPWHYYADELRENDNRILETGESVSVYERILRHDGTRVDIVSKKELLFDKNKTLIGLIGFSLVLPKSSQFQTLTSREYNIVQLLSEGYTDKEIAKKLGLSPRTIETHVNNAKQKLSIKTRAELISQFARQHQ
jgi:DNA-binding CsgD family transcriptional regulator